MVRMDIGWTRRVTLDEINEFCLAFILLITKAESNGLSEKENKIMNSEVKALLKGIVIGLVCALVALIARTLIVGNGFVDNLKSVYGILVLICFPLGIGLFYYFNQKKKGE